MKRTSISLDEEQAASPERLAEQEGMSRAELIRQMLNRALANAEDNLGSDLQTIDDSFGALRDVDLQVRRPSAREERLGRVWSRTS